MKYALNSMRSLATLIILFGSLIVEAKATTIAYEDWHLGTDSLGGLRQSTWDSTAFFAVSASTIWDPTATYLAPTGYHVATTAEGLALFDGGNIGGNYVYYGQGGWSGYTWESGVRLFFRFSDSNITDGLKHAGNYDPYYVQYDAYTGYFAGMVLIADATVPETTSTISLILAGSLLCLAQGKFRSRKA